MKLKKFNLFLVLLLFLTPVESQELQNKNKELKSLGQPNEYNFYAGTFFLV